VEALEKLHREYVSEVSSPEMAISMELAAELWRQLDARQPKRILDLGSGFSSALFRLWARDQDTTVTSLDTDGEWLRKTHTFLARHGLTTRATAQWQKPQGDLALWQGWRPEGQYDFILHDLGSLGWRLRTLRQIVNKLLSPGGTVVFDDCHWEAYPACLGQLCDKYGLAVEYLKERTKDRFGRYAALAVRHDPPKEADERPRIVLGIPMVETPEYQCVYSWMMLVAQKVPFFPLPPYPNVAIARNEIAWNLLFNPFFNYVLMLDADHKHPATIVWQLGRHVQEDPTRLVVAGLNNRRGPPFDPCAYYVNEEGKSVFVKRDWEPRLQKIDRVGTAAILIAREVFERMEPPWFEFDMKEQADNRQYKGEDMTFSNECRLLGIDIWLDPMANSPHRYTSWVDMQTFRNYCKEHLQQDEDGIDVLQVLGG
jgi:predicted O-methyltransferase YrrM